MNALPETLLKSARAHNLVPFVGAGVSMAVCRKDGERLFPNWRDLLRSGADRLKKEADNGLADVVRGYAQSGDVLKAADALKTGLGGLFFNWIRESLTCSHSEVESGSLELPKLIWELGSNLILTTNYDPVLRWACPRPQDLDEWSRIPSISSLEQVNGPTVWHLHGALTRPRDIVLSQEDYKKLYDSSNDDETIFKLILGDVLRSRTLLFIGFSLDDIYLQAELAWLQKLFSYGAGRHFILVAEDRRELTQKSLKDLKTVQVLSYETHGQPLINALSLIRDATCPVPHRIAAIDSLPKAFGTSAAMDAYLELSQSINGQLEVPGNPSKFSIESVWVEPRFITEEGEESLYKVLRNRALVIEAPAGAGKTTLARFISTMIARDWCRHKCPIGDSWQQAFLGVKPGVPQVPILINLRDFDPNYGVEGIFSAAWPTIDENLLRELRPFLNRGEVVFVLDGLDEVSLAIRPKIVQALLLAHQRWHNCYFLVTARPGDMSLLARSGFKHIKLAELPFATGLKLVQRWLTVLFEQKSEAGAFVERFQRLLARSPELKQMLTSPLFVSFLCWNYKEFGNLPANKASLYKSVAEWLLKSRSDQRIAAKQDTPTTKLILASIAFSLLNGIKNQGPVASADYDAVIAGASSLLHKPKNEIEEAMRVEFSHGSCINDHQGRISFWHLNLRDYFAARWLVHCHTTSVADLPLSIRAAMLNPTWRECVDIFVGLLAIESPDLVSKFIESIGSLSGTALSHSIVRTTMRSRMLEVAIMHAYRPDPTYRDALRNESKALLEDLGKSNVQLVGMDPKDRISVFTILGATQPDPRLYGKPSSRAKPVTPGSNWRMGIYPVTVQEFSRFIRGGGYEDGRWSREFRKLYSEKRWEAPLDWEHQKLTPNAPVVGVSWHEATAYCRWLCVELAEDGMIVRLPTIAEWISACPMQIQNNFKWPLRDLENQSLNLAVPVGIFPELQGSGGHCDLVSSIWEWLGPKNPASNSIRHRRLYITCLSTQEKFCPDTRSTRGVRRALNIGFRIVIEPNAKKRDNS